MDLRFYLSIFLRRLPWFLTVAVLGAALGIGLAVILPAKYRAQALLLVESEQIPDRLAPSTVQTGANEELSIIEQRLTTRANLIEVASRLGLYADRPGLDAQSIVEDMRARLELVVTAPRDAAPTLTVAFEGPTPQQALQGTNEFVTLIQRENVEMRTGRATQTLDFFRQEVDRLGADLDRQQAELLAFRQANQNSLPDSLDYRRTQQRALQERLILLQRDEATATDRRAALVELYERTGRVETAGTALSPEEQQLRQAEAQLAEALLIYSPQNPRVRVLQARVDALKRTVAGQVEAGAATAAPQDPEPTLLELQLAEIDSQLGIIAEERAQIQGELDALTASIDATPANAVRLSELERENQITQDQYNQAVARLAAAQTGERIEVLSKGQRISVIEQAELPSGPSSPNRLLIAGGGVAGGLALGLGLVLLLELLNRAIRRPVEITQRLGITPIATLPYLRSARETMLRRATFSAVALVGAAGIVGVLYALHTYYLPMDILLARVMEKTGLAALFGEIRQGISG